MAKNTDKSTFAIFPFHHSTKLHRDARR